MTHGTKMAGRLAALMAFGGLMVLGGGCQSSGRGEAGDPPMQVWVPAASVVTPSIDRRSFFAIGPSADEQVLVVTRRVDEPGRLASDEQWVVEVPMSPALNTPIAVGEGTAFEAIVIEYLGDALGEGPNESFTFITPSGRPADLLAGGARPGVPLTGTVLIERAGSDTLVAVLDLVGEGQPRDAGVVVERRPRLSGRFELERTVVPAIASVQPRTRSGMEHPTQEDRQRLRDRGSIYSAESYKETGPREREANDWWR